MSVKYTEEEIKLRVERSVIDGKLKELAKQKRKQDRKEAIKFYRDELLKLGFDVYFWDPAKKYGRQEKKNEFYRVCFAYKKVKEAKNLYFAFVSFCHPDDNFDRWLAWGDLYNQGKGHKSNTILYVNVEDSTKKNLYEAFRKGIVNNYLNRGEKPSLFKKHCKTILKDV